MIPQIVYCHSCSKELQVVTPLDEWRTMCIKYKLPVCRECSFRTNRSNRITKHYFKDSQTKSDYIKQIVNNYHLDLNELETLRTLTSDNYYLITPMDIGSLKIHCIDNKKQLKELFVRLLTGECAFNLDDAWVLHNYKKWNFKINISLCEV